MAQCNLLCTILEPSLSSEVKKLIFSIIAFQFIAPFRKLAVGYQHTGCFGHATRQNDRRSTGKEAVEGTEQFIRRVNIAITFTYWRELREETGWKTDATLAFVWGRLGAKIQW